jgi:type IX secretion system PorP/SprF family membrane protein
MKKIIIILSLIVICYTSLRAQQLSMYSNYICNPSLICPAYAGMNDYSIIHLTYRNHWTNLNEANISTQVLSGHTSIDNYGVGGVIYNDTYGNTSLRGAKFTYSKQFQLSDNGLYLGIGANISAISFSINQENYQFFDENDEAISGMKESSFTPNLDFGFALRNEKFRVGLSVFQVLESKLTLADNTSSDNTLIRHYYLNTAYNIEISDNFVVEPSILTRFTERTTVNLDVNAILYYQNNYFMGLSWKTTGFFSVLAGFNYKSIHFAYACDLSTGKLRSLSSTSHELMLGFQLPLPNSNASKTLL